MQYPGVPHRRSVVAKTGPDVKTAGMHLGVKTHDREAALARRGDERGKQRGTGPESPRAGIDRHPADLHGTCVKDVIPPGADCRAACITQQRMHRGFVR